MVLLAREVQLLVERDDDRDGSQKYSRNRLGLQCPPLVGLMVETRPTLLELKSIIVLIASCKVILNRNGFAKNN